MRSLVGNVCVSSVMTFMWSEKPIWAPPHLRRFPNVAFGNKNQGYLFALGPHRKSEVPFVSLWQVPFVSRWQIPPSAPTPASPSRYGNLLQFQSVRHKTAMHILSSPLSSLSRRRAAIRCQVYVHAIRCHVNVHAIRCHVNVHAIRCHGNVHAIRCHVNGYA